MPEQDGPQRVVAFQGERGAYSEEAALQYFGPGIQPLPCRTLPEVFQAVEDRRATDGLIPIENSLAGSINESYDLLLRHALAITGEAVLRVRHCLLAPPGQPLATLRRVASHPQALAQCAAFLASHNLEPVPAYDTAGSAQALAGTAPAGNGAIAARRAGELYGLTVLAEGIESNPGNYTRFYAVNRSDGAAVPEPGGPSREWKSVLVFAAAHRPGSLYWCLGAFAYRGIDLLKLESRPVPGRPWEYLFYADIRGHRGEDHVAEALRELETKAASVRVLGSFPAAGGYRDTFVATSR